MTGDREQLLRTLADGEVHSGEQLARQLGISRAGIWKRLQSLEDIGIQVQARPGKGYWLPHSLELLEQQTLRSMLNPASRARIASLEVHWTLQSTNARLLAMSAPDPGFVRVCFAEFQSGGRGRRGRSWQSPFAHGLCFSLSWCFPVPPPQLSALSLAVGVSVARLLHDICAAPVSVKWPNDILLDERKLCGILVEVQGEADGPLHVVVGVGINLLPDSRLDQSVMDTGGLVPAALFDHVTKVSRMQLAAAMVDKLCATMVDFSVAGFGRFSADWQRFDGIFERSVQIHAGREMYRGVARGVSSNGGLLVLVEGVQREFVSGEVSVRA